MEGSVARFPASIYMVPATLRDLSPSSFTPQFVCIGPFHRENEKLREKSKSWKASHQRKLLSRINAPKDQVLELCRRKVQALLEQIKACYVWTKTYDDAEITDMMVFDAFFILEFILDIQNYGSMVIDLILHDFVLLENQIPLFVLDDLFQLTVLTFNPKASLVEFLRPVLSRHPLFEANINIDNVFINDAPHIFGLLHQCYMPPIYDIAFHSPRLRTYSLVGLVDKEWVTIKPHKDHPTWIMGMELESASNIYALFGPWNKPTLRVPVLYFTCYSESVLRNLIAYEQPYDESRKYVTSYVYAMRMLMDTPEDVDKLVDSGVVYSGEKKEVCDMFKGVNVIVGEDEDYLEWKKTNKNCNGWSTTSCFSHAWNAIAPKRGVDHLYRYVRHKEHVD